MTIVKILDALHTQTARGFFYTTTTPSELSNKSKSAHFDVPGVGAHKCVLTLLVRGARMLLRLFTVMAQQFERDSVYLK
jgi:hypothetical protein